MNGGRKELLWICPLPLAHAVAEYEVRFRHAQVGAGPPFFACLPRIQGAPFVAEIVLALLACAPPSLFLL